MSFDLSPTSIDAPIDASHVPRHVMLRDSFFFQKPAVKKKNKHCGRQIT